MKCFKFDVVNESILGSISGVTVAGSTSNPGPYAYQFSSPTAITFDLYGYMYVLDTGNSRVQRWLPGASYGTTVIASTMSNAYGMQIDRYGNIVIADTYNYRILFFGISCRKLSFIISFFAYLYNKDKRASEVFKNRRESKN
jgi:hypothetical protein